MLKIQSQSALSKRKSTRRVAHNCIIMIDGRAYPVYNWSDGGVLIQADERLFSVGAPIDITLKFRLSDKILDIPHTGTIIRKARDKLAVQFAPISKEIQTKFQQVVDDMVTREFMESQIS